MPTLMLTTRCPNACPWCFARAKMADYRNRGILEIGWDDFVEAAAFFERSGESGIHLLGGEPLLHSRIVNILEYLRGRDLKIIIGTTAVVPPSLVDRLAGMKFRDISFGVNSTSYFSYGPRKKANVDYFLRNIGHRTGISYTMTEQDLNSKDPSPILGRIALITRFSLVHHVTLQLAVPAEGNRGFVVFERYGEIVDLAANWIRIFEKNHITCHLDCHSIPACRYPEGHPLGRLLRPSCQSFPLDIGPDLTVWPCFPLAGMGVPLGRFRDVSEVRQYFAEALRRQDFQNGETCRDCLAMAEGKCHGGCFGFQVIKGKGDRQRFYEARTGS
jgi:MoaA/NifB/PqqE/SkfB family radical SAM enzyme